DGKRRIACDHTPQPRDLPSHQTESVSLDKARNNVMIDLSKATKGRRMSKKPRKKASISTSARKSVAQLSAEQGASPGKSRLVSSRKSTRKDGTAAKQLKPSRGTLAQTSKVADRESMKKSKALVEGAMAPRFRLPRDGGGAVRLSDLSGRKLVLFFY